MTLGELLPGLLAIDTEKHDSSYLTGKPSQVANNCEPPELPIEPAQLQEKQFLFNYDAGDITEEQSIPLKGYEMTARPIHDIGILVRPFRSREGAKPYRFTNLFQERRGFSTGLLSPFPKL